LRGEEVIEGVFQANHKGKSSGNLQGKKPFKNNKGKAERSSKKQNFSPCFNYGRTNHAEKDCWYKDKLFFIVFSAIILVIVKSIAEPRKNNLNSKHNNMQI
jgi:hypothetical protein